MIVNEIFKSIEGEGIRSGYPVTFIRLFGCNLNCTYCDTRYACEGVEGTEMTAVEILHKVRELNEYKVTITGGEPLIHKDINKLVSVLVANGYEVNIETNGSVNVLPYTMSGNSLMDERIIITSDFKSPSSGMRKEMLYANLDYLRHKDVLKFVVGSIEDLEDMRDIIRYYHPICQIFVSPIFDKINPVDIVNFILENRLSQCRVQLQIHKIIWEPSQRGV